MLGKNNFIQKASLSRWAQIVFSQIVFFSLWKHCNLCFFLAVKRSVRPIRHYDRMAEISIGLDLDWTGSRLWRILLILDWIQTVNHFEI